MVRVLHVDCTRGMSAASFLAALVDLGVAPSPILRALGSLQLPIELRFQSCGDGTTVHVEPENAPMPVPVGGVRALLDEMGAPERATRLAQDAVGRLLVSEVTHLRALQRDPMGAHVDASALACLTGAALAVDALAPERVQASRIAIPEEPTPALVELLGDWSDHLEFGLGDVTTDGAAMLRALCDDADVGHAEPAWRGHASRGIACDIAGVGVALGEE